LKEAITAIAHDVNALGLFFVVFSFLLQSGVMCTLCQNCSRISGKWGNCQFVAEPNAFQSCWISSSV